MAETLLGESEIDELEQLLAEKPQLILYGAPGTGKTFLAERLASYLTRNGGETRVVQFHPSYGYEDFVEGIRPVVSTGSDASAGQVGYRVEPGIFREMCDQARRRPKDTFVLVVDEINRGNLPRIFGELLYLLERRGQEVKLPISRQSFSVPANLFVIGTMNTADQSIALVDVALRRRFHFFALAPNPPRLREWLATHAPRMVDVANVLQRLNDALRDEGIDENLFIGHAHFMRKGLDELGLQRVWQRSIEPTLEEYFYGKRDKVARFRHGAFVEGELVLAPEEAPGE
jgi:5-methylcytosine-specific restriction protein B